jgi:hypothetical protein
VILLLMLTSPMLLLPLLLLLPLRTGSLWGSVILLLMLTSLMLQLAGAMKLAGIEVNAGEEGAG